MSDNQVLLKNIFSDFPIFLTKNSFTGDLNLTKDMSSVKNSIKNIVMTNIGERGFDYDFGGNISSILFEPMHDDFRLSAHRIRLANILTRYEPRVAVDKIIFDTSTNYINIIIEYSLLTLNTKDKVTIKLERSR